MAQKTKDELLVSLKNFMGDNITDEALALIGDVSDTFDSLTAKSGEDWEKKYRENDKAWREKYRERFFSGTGNEEEEEFEEENERERYRYENLFKEA